MTRNTVLKILFGIFLIGLMVTIYFLIEGSEFASIIADGKSLQNWIAQFGVWGPVAIISLMALAILISPLPSAPIALAAGAAYGHIWGTIYVLAGAEAGALAAFGIARLLGHKILKQWFGSRLSTGWMGSQNMLMFIVFASRLLPFISFDLVSYAAGLTALRFWRFGIATLAGIIPSSFLLAHFGGEMTSGETDRIILSIVLLGGLTLIPLLIKIIGDKWKRSSFK